MKEMIKKVQVNIPFRMLIETYLDQFLQLGLNPEIGFDALALEEFSVKDYRPIAEKLHQQSLRITLHGPFIDLSVGSADPGIRALTRKRFEQVLELVPLFKPQTLICHAGYDKRRYGFFRDVWIERSLACWSWLADRLEETGTRLMLENVYEDGPTDIRILFEELAPKNVGFCLDTGHLTAFGQTSLMKWLTVMEPYLGQLHLHDNNGDWDDHLELGGGAIDFKYLFEYLKRTRKRPPIVTLEPHQEAHLLPSLEYLAHHWPWQ